MRSKNIPSVCCPSTEGWEKGEKMPQVTNDAPQSAGMKQLDNLMQQGYHQMEAHHASPKASDVWGEAWEMVKRLSRTDLRTAASFDRTYPALRQSVENWTYDVDIELHNAGLAQAQYHERRIQFVHEFFALFPDDKQDTSRLLNFMRAEGEALWNLGRREESDQVYRHLIELLPDESWGYIGWADDYWAMFNSPKDYQRGESILLQALERPHLQDRVEVLERLEDLYIRWGKPERAGVIGSQLEQLLTRPSLVARLRSALPFTRSSPPQAPEAAPPVKKLGRNERCWSGSGKKYPHCHWKSDQG